MFVRRFLPILLVTVMVFCVFDTPNGIAQEQNTLRLVLYHPYSGERADTLVKNVTRICEERGTPEVTLIPLDAFQLKMQAIGDLSKEGSVCLMLYENDVPTAITFVRDDSVESLIEALKSILPGDDTKLNEALKKQLSERDSEISRLNALLSALSFSNSGGLDLAALKAELLSLLKQLSEEERNNALDFLFGDTDQDLIDAIKKQIMGEEEEKTQKLLDEKDKLIAERDQMIADRDKQITTLTRTLDEKNDKITYLNDLVITLREKVSRLEQSGSNDVLSKEIADLKAQNEALRLEIYNLQAQKSGDYDALVAENSRLKSELEAQKAKLAASKEIIADLEARVIELENTHIAVLDGRVSRAEYEFVCNQRDAANARIRELEYALAAAQSEIYKLQEALDVAQEELTAARKKISDLQAALAAAQAEIDYLNALAAAQAEAATQDAAQADLSTVLREK